MDSLTQITLGAAVGEVVLGKKVGNRAMLYGAIGGTIPDLDIIANFLTDEMTALAMHRGFSHSFLFAATAPVVLGWLTHKLYSSGLYQKQGYKAGAMSFWMIFYALAAFGLYNIPKMVGGEPSNIFAMGALVIGLLLFQLLRTRYYKPSLEKVDASWKDWGWLYFWSIFTHPLLDCCTAYGTQVFQPFWDYRVAFNTISVVDPIYTLPFIICVVIASRLLRHSPRRRFFNYLGIGLSSAYLLLCTLNKLRIDKVFERSLEKQEIVYERYMTSPTIFNNVLYHCLAEGDTAFYSGLYSIFDEGEGITEMNVYPKRHHLLDGYQNDPSIETLKWFSGGYYNIIDLGGGKLQLNDLRYGALGEKAESEKDFVFRFILEEKNGKIEAHQTREGNADERTFASLWERMKGKKAGAFGNSNSRREVKD